MFKVDASARVEDAPGFNRMFAPGRLTLGLFFPIEAFLHDQPAMRDQERLATWAQALDFAALWSSAPETRSRAHTGSSRSLSGTGRRGVRYTWPTSPKLGSRSGTSRHPSRSVLTGAAELVPKPMGRLPLLVTGNSGQPLPWIAAHSDGWITYPRSIERQAETVARWRGQVQEAAPGRFKPFAQSLYIDPDAVPQLPPVPIHPGKRAPPTPAITLACPRLRSSP